MLIFSARVTDKAKVNIYTTPGMWARIAAQPNRLVYCFHPFWEAQTASGGLVILFTDQYQQCRLLVGVEGLKIQADSRCADSQDSNSYRCAESHSPAHGTEYIVSCDQAACVATSTGAVPLLIESPFFPSAGALAGPVHNRLLSRRASVHG